MPIDYVAVTNAPLAENAEPHRVRMRDGVHLATDVYRCSGEPGPTVLIRVPYDKSGSYAFIPAIADYFTAHGYHVVAQDVRGKHRSEGETLLWVNEVVDGYDTIDWIVQQDFSDGVVGTWGDSYYGYTQWASVASGHQALRAISPRLTGTRLAAIPVDEPGVDRREVEMSVMRLYPCTFFHSNDSYFWELDWKSRPYAASVEEFFSAVGSRSISYDLCFPETVELRRFPHGHPFDAKAIPVLQTIGWFDNCAPWQWDDHAKLSQRAAWANQEYLVIDSIDHEGYHLTHGTRNLKRTAEEVLALLPETLDPTIEFFDVFLKNHGSPSSIPRVRWNLAHTEGLRPEASWPPPGIVDHVLHLADDSTLSAVPPAEANELTWTHDPDDLVPSPASDPFSYVREYPDERGLAARSDVLTFDGPPTDTATALVGAVRFDGTFRSNGPTMDVFIRLVDVAPDGAAHLVARGQLHLRRPARGTRASIDLTQVGYRLAEGHHLRVHVASSDFPDFIPQPGTGEHPWLAAEVCTNEQTLMVGGPDGARLSFSVLPDAEA